MVGELKVAGVLLLAVTLAACATRPPGSEQPGIVTRRPAPPLLARDVALKRFREAFVRKFPDVVVGNIAPEAGMHLAPVTDADVDLAEGLVVTGSSDKTARVWRLTDGQLVHVLRIPGSGESGQIFAVAISPQGQVIAVGGWEGTVYLFRVSDWRLAGTISGMASIVSMRFAPDGKRLAVGLFGHNGLRVFDTDGYQTTFIDRDYGGPCYGLAFSKGGDLAVASWDRTVRLYSPEHTLLAKRQFDERPHRLAFDPRGEVLAVGSFDRPVVRVLKVPNLDIVSEVGVTPRAPTDTLASVTWSADGAEVFGSGRYDDEKGYNVIEGWLRNGTKVSQWRLNTNTTNQIIGLGDGELLVAAQDPLVGVLDPRGGPRWVRRPDIADLSGQQTELRFSDDLSTLQFAWRRGDPDLLTFELRGLRFVDRAQVPLRPATTNAPGLVVENWRSATGPILNGHPLSVDPSETCRALAIDRARGKFLLGCEWNLYEFDGSGRLQWKRGFPASSRGVSLSGDGRMAVVAMEDGTFRWVSTDEGRVVLSLFVYAKGRDWVAWTPDGFFAGSPFGESLLGIHALRRDGTADLLPMLDFADLMRRPEIIVGSLESVSR